MTVQPLPNVRAERNDAQTAVAQVAERALDQFAREAVALVRSLSTDDSPRFVNGLLARLLDLKPTLQR